MSKPFERVALIGVGLINGSLALAMRERSLADRLVGCARNEATRARALELGLIDEARAAPADAVRDADLVVIGTPPAACGAVARAFAPALREDAIVTDVASIKQRVLDDVPPALADPSRFVAGHPVAGTENSGPDAAFATLFVQRRTILTPTSGTDPDCIDRIEALWRAVGASVDRMDAEHHDRVLAITSHLPHLIAFSIVGTVADLEREAQTEVFRYAAGGFTDFTRIASSDPTMWRDVFLHNRDAVLEMLGRFSEDLAALQKAIRRGDGETLHAFFGRTREIHRGVRAAGQAYERVPEPPSMDDDRS